MSNLNSNQYADDRNSFRGAYNNQPSFSPMSNRQTNIQGTSFLNYNSTHNRELSTEEKQEIKEVFDIFDMDKDNQLDAQQLRLALRALGFKMEKREVINILQNYNSSNLPMNNQTIDLDHFEHLMIKMISTRDPEVELSDAFKLFDVEGTGKITPISLAQIANELGENISPEEINAMIDEFDFDQDGGINFEEFRSIMKN